MLSTQGLNDHPGVCRPFATQAMRRTVDGIAAAHGVRARVSYDTVFPATINDAAATRDAVRAAAALVGAAPERVDGACEAKLFSEVRARGWERSVWLASAVVLH